MIALGRGRTVVVASIALFAIFVYDIVAASLTVARIVLAPTRSNVPAIVAIPVDARTEWGVALFAYLVSLTPGSTKPRTRRKPASVIAQARLSKPVSNLSRLSASDNRENSFLILTYPLITITYL